VANNSVFVFVAGILVAGMCHLSIARKKERSIGSSSDAATRTTPPPTNWNLLSSWKAVPHKYSFSLPIRFDSPTAAEQTQSAVPEVRPWIRFWARLFDIWVFSFFFFFFAAGLVAILAPESNFMATAFHEDNKFREENELWFGMACLFAWVFVEAILLSTLGTTPGKWLFRIKLLPPTGLVPTYPAAVSRSIAVWWRGLGTGFPVVSLCTLIFAKSRLRENGITSWDKDEGFTVVHQRIGTTRSVVAIVFFAVSFGLIVQNDVASDLAQSTKHQAPPQQQVSDHTHAADLLFSLDEYEQSDDDDSRLLDAPKDEVELVIFVP
jgi:uncharacterized RDD family membrane protein YckC